MSLKFYKPVNNSTRGKIRVDTSHLWKGSPFKALTKGFGSSGGRNNQGRMTVRARVTPHKKVYREILFKRNVLAGIEAEIIRFEYDPNRTAHIALVKYEVDSEVKHAYVIAVKGMKIGQKLMTSSSSRIDYFPGNAMPLEYIKDGTIVCCVELKIAKGAGMARSAGAKAQVLGTDEKGRKIIKLTSGELKAVNKKCFATIGEVSNADHSNEVLAKAGASFRKGRRPKVRGIAMNPVDHHNGGRANGGTHFASPQGLCAKGKKTRRNKRTTHTIIKGRKK